MNNVIPFTPAQREALRLMVGIDENTHPQCFSVEFIHEDCGPSVNPNIRRVTCTLPCPLTGGIEADDVWLAPLWRSLKPYSPELWWSERFNCHGSQILSGKGKGNHETSPTAALLLAARAANIKEVVDIFNLSCDTTTAPTEEA